MKWFEATYQWTMTCTRIIEANDEDDAWCKAEELGFEIVVDREGWYVEDTFRLREVAPDTRCQPKHSKRKAKRQTRNQGASL